MVESSYLENQRPGLRANGAEAEGARRDRTGGATRARGAEASGGDAKVRRAASGGSSSRAHGGGSLALSYLLVGCA
jgi:hypothetical protein